MPIWRTNTRTGEEELMNARQIKAEIIERTGWTNVQYQKQYDILRNKQRGYEYLIGQKRDSPVNETLLRIVRKQDNGMHLTPKEEAIVNFTSQSTGKRTYSLRLQEYAKTFLVGEVVTIDNVTVYQNSIFSGLLNKSATARKAYTDWLNEVVETRREKNSETGKMETIEVLRSSTVTPREINEFLGQEAKKLHERQAKEYKENSGAYKSKRSVGSD